MNKVWTRASSILGLLLLLSLCPPLSVFCEYQENSDNVFFQQSQEQAKSIDGSNSFPEGDRDVLNADLNRWCQGILNVYAALQQICLAAYTHK